MDTALEHIIYEFQHTSPAKLAGAVKTYPLRELMKSANLIQHAMLRKGLDPQQARVLEQVYKKIQEIIKKRIEAAHQLVAKFADATPEIIALNNSVFSLVPSRDLLEDINVVFNNSPQQLADFSRASANIIEAVNIEIQQRFYELRPETIAIHYSGQVLDSYRRLLKNLLTHIEVDSDIFKIYTTIIRNVIEGSKIHQSQISVAKAFCNRVFQTSPPAYNKVLGAYTSEELEKQEKILQTSLEILERDITGRPSIVEFTNQCRQLLIAIADHFAERKMQMRKTTRVLQLSYYISFLATEKVSENATTSLMLCQLLFEDTRQFLVNQQSHLDVMLNVRSIDDALYKVEEGLRYRQYAIGQLLKEILTLSADDLSVVSEKYLGDSNLLLQEIRNLAEDFLQRTAPPHPEHITGIAHILKNNIKKLQQAILMSRTASLDAPPIEFDRTLPNLSKFYDEELVTLIRKALKTSSSSQKMEESASLENSFTIPVDRLQTYLEAFIRIVQPD